MKTRWYLHNNCSTTEIKEQLEYFLNAKLSSEAMETLVNEIRSKFYEIGFDVDFDEKTGKITNIEIKKY